MTHLQQLAQATLQIGRDPLLTQGAGGNTSLKGGDILWVKASGAWMRDADTKQIFVQAPLSGLRDILREGDEAALAALSQSCTTPDGLRPSIESVLHAAMPHDAVIHAHAINSTVCSVLVDGETRFLEAMASLGLKARVVPYLTPGLPLAREIGRTDEVADVLLLQNHGVVVGAGNPARALQTLRAVETALTFPIRQLLEASPLESRSARFESCPEHAGIACDADLCASLTRAPLTPDQVVFLGGAPLLASSTEAVEDAAEKALAVAAPAPVLFYVQGRGAMCRRGLTAGQRAQCDAVAEIAKRLPHGAEVRGLTQEQARTLIDWEAEKFRRSADAARG